MALRSRFGLPWCDPGSPEVKTACGDMGTEFGKTALLCFQQLRSWCMDECANR